VFDLRTEAEMRLHSEKTARELALKKQREEGVEGGEDVEDVEDHIVSQTPPSEVGEGQTTSEATGTAVGEEHTTPEATVTADAESVG
jgi:hypothetical protein